MEAGAPILEVGAALVLMAGAGLLARRVGLSLAPALILAGLAVGSHLPSLPGVDLSFRQSTGGILFLGRLGMLLLMFYLGLEFSVGRLLRAGRSVLWGGAVYLALNFSLGLLLPWLLGWSLQQMLLAAGITTISSSAIVAKVLVDLKRTANPETEIILGIMIVQDVFLAVYLAVLSGWILTGALSPAGTALSGVTALAVVSLPLLLGRRLLPLLDRWLDIPSDEVFLLALLATVTLIAGAAALAGVAEPVGALLAGLVLAETRHRHRIQSLVLPLRDFFAAAFFFSFGLRIDPRLLGGAVGPALAAVGLTVLGNVAAGLAAGRGAGLSPRASLNVGLTILARGEFSIVVANVARTAGLGAVLQPFTALYVIVLAVTGPLLTRESRRVHRLARRAGVRLTRFWRFAAGGRRAG